jgi:hypothetical protein
MDAGAAAIREESYGDFFLFWATRDGCVCADGSVGPFKRVWRLTNTRPDEMDTLPTVFPLSLILIDSYFSSQFLLFPFTVSR